MTIREALYAAREQLSALESARYDAQTLLSHVLKVNTAYLSGYPEQVLTPEQEDEFKRLVMLRAASMPLAYVLQSRGFYDRDFIVSPAVLIPRPETEHLVEAALE